MAMFFRKGKASAATTGVAEPPGLGAEARVRELGEEMLSRARSHRTSVLSSKFYSDALMEWSMKDPQFKVQMFRFVDAFPMLKTPEAVFEHLKDYLSQPGVTVPGTIAAALKAGGLAKGLAAKTISSQITSMASKFIAGTDAASALPGLRTMWDEGIAFSVDLLGETCVSDEEADHYAKKYLDLVENLPREVAGWSAQDRLERDHLGPIPRTNVSIKISALSARCDPIDTPGAMADLGKRLEPILESARDRGVFVNFDMEHYELKDFTIELFQRCVERVGFEGGLAMQAYLRSGPEDARRMIEWAKGKGKVVTVRLVKGAYWDAQLIKAEMNAWPCPVWTRKWETDACFEKMAARFIEGVPARAGEPGVKLALGSHNVRSIAAALVALERRGLSRSAIELQMLHGMADQLKHAAGEMGLRVREYVPVGDMIPGMAYLVRRLLENTSNESWLKAGFLDQADAGVLLRAPAPKEGEAGERLAEGAAMAARHRLSPRAEGVGDGVEFLNEPLRDFSDRAQHAAFSGAIARSRVPEHPGEVDVPRAREMVGEARRAFEGWERVPWRARAGALVSAARAMRERRDEISGVIVRESGKSWREADADVCEAIDFCEYYARQASTLFDRERIGRYIGELDEQWYQARGVAVVIAPWNFPLAIAAGMTVAALVTGNSVVLKPAEQTVGVARLLVDVLQPALAAAGAPPGTLRFCPGAGESVGAALVRDERVALVAFTGSRDVGCDILTASAPGSPFADASLRERLTHVKRVVCEMGGKNAIIVDTSADFDEAVLGVRQSAFGFQGQKCSACSRCVVVDPQGAEGPAITQFVHRLVQATRALTIGDPMLPGTDVGPVIDAEAQGKIAGFIERAKGSGLRWAGLEVPPGLEERTGRRFIGPHIFWNVPEGHELAREEIFGPVLAVMHASSFAEALRIANASRYKLTGGVFTRMPSHIELAKREFRVGNLYINRGITGALVARQPFGGFGMSGVGSKAGGRDYLLQFVEPRASCENTMRRGFAPEL